MALPPELQQGLLGSWSGTYRVWLEPGAAPHECETAATCAPELEDRFVAYRYDWSYERAPQHGYALLGCTDAGEYQMAWTDTWHNGNAIMFCTGAGPDPIVTGAWAEDYPGGAWHWRTEFTFADPDTLTVTAFNITPAGAEMTATEARYSRVR